MNLYSYSGGAYASSWEEWTSLRTLNICSLDYKHLKGRARGLFHLLMHIKCLELYLPHSKRPVFTSGTVDEGPALLALLPWGLAALLTRPLQGHPN